MQGMYSQLGVGYPLTEVSQNLAMILRVCIWPFRWCPRDYAGIYLEKSLIIRVTDPCWLRLGLCSLDADHQVIRALFLQPDLCQQKHEADDKDRHGLGAVLEFWQPLTDCMYILEEGLLSLMALMNYTRLTRSDSSSSAPPSPSPTIPTSPTDTAATKRPASSPSAPSTPSPTSPSSPSPSRPSGRSRRAPAPRSTCSASSSSAC